ncbi:MAG TPA: hypothetical protein VEC16_02520 [Alphaproteobacteria bacterium]|nr:hypothetical protein [Alphaproteobacteria bacterium]
MNWIKTIWIVPMLLALVLSGCSTSVDVDNTLIRNESGGQTFCTEDAKICADGSAVGRNPNNNCEFYPCPDGSN